MGICTQCGVIMNDADIGKHVCNPADVPSVGTAKKPTTTPVAVV
jgi:uncharacterized membrane protein